MDDKSKQRQSLAALKQTIIQALDIKEFYQSIIKEEIRAKSDGWSELVHCTIHNDTGKKNLSVNIHSGGFKCFACGKSGSVFDFYCYANGTDPKTGFQQALIALANKCNINIGDLANTKTAIPLASEPSEPLKTELPKHYAPNVNKADTIDSSKTPLRKALIKTYQNNLGPSHYKYLHFTRGLKDAWISRFQIGWNPNYKYKTVEGIWTKGRFTIPIYSKSGELRNIRLHASDCDPAYKMLNTKGYGSPPRLFPLPLLLEYNWKNLIYCEGEWDCMLMIQMLDEAGLLTDWGCVTNTHGCASFESEWMEYFAGRNIYFCFDADSSGKTWSQSICTKHFLAPLSAGKIPQIKILHLPIEGGKDSKDITDFFVKLNYKIEDFLLTVQNTPAISIGGNSMDELITPPLEVDDFIQCVMDRRYIDEYVKVPFTISGQSTKIYHATRSFKVTACPLMKEDSCCAVVNEIQIIPYGDISFIEACAANKQAMAKILQCKACTKGKACTVEEVEKVVMEEYFGHQVIKRMTTEEDEQGRMVNSQELLTRSIYVLQPENSHRIGPQDYTATGYIRSHPLTRQVTYFAEHLEPMEEDWRKFQVNEESIPKLKKIQELGVRVIFDDITNHVTKIYKSDEVLLTVLLTYLSPLSFSFNGTLIRGWINSCIIGDTGTGKSATYMRISDWLDLGDLFSALSGTRTGLLYSIKQKGVEWYVQIGRYVMANGKIIAIDETQESEAEEIKKMAIAMDEGWLEVSQVASGGYHTQVRTLFLLNPKHGKKISDFAYGCQALTECFDPMFIRRLDVAVFTTSVNDYKFYNQHYKPEESVPGKLSSDTFKSLVYWAWTRTVNDIFWSDEATIQCLKTSVDLANVYGHADDVPLVNPQDFRNNLARLSTAFAILSGSFTEDYTGVNVTQSHVLKMEEFLNMVYSSTTCNLKQYSKINKNKKVLLNYESVAETFTKVINLAEQSASSRIREGKHFLQLVLLLQNQQCLKKRDLLIQLGVSAAWVQKHLAILQMHDLIELYKGGYKATRKFNLFLQEWMKNEDVEKQLADLHVKLGELALQNYNEADFDFSKQNNDPFYEESESY